MGQDINVDWNALAPPRDFIGDYANAYKAGQDLARQGAVDRAGANAFSRPPTVDPAEAGLEPRIAAMSAAEKSGAARRADLLAAVGLGLKGVPYEQRAAVLAHMTAPLTALGAPAAAIARFDPTDEALDAAVASARSLGERLAPAG